MTEEFERLIQALGRIADDIEDINKTLRDANKYAARMVALAEETHPAYNLN